MAKTMTKPETPTASIPECEATLAGLRTEQADCGQRASGRRERMATRREVTRIVTVTGAVERREIDVPVLEQETFGPIERLQARRRLLELADEIPLAEERLERAKQDAAEAVRAQRARGIAEGEVVMRRELPGLIDAVRALQQRFAGFHAELTRLDQTVGAEYFRLQAACPPLMPGQTLDAWCAYVAGCFPAERR